MGRPAGTTPPRPCALTSAGSVGVGVAERPVTTSSLAANDGRLLRYVLDDLHYPARWWEIMAIADMYGLAASQHAELARLPRALYPDVAAILRALTAPDPSPAANPAARRGSRDVRHSTVRRPPGHRHGFSTRR